jgi:hypothetical protein
VTAQRFVPIVHNTFVRRKISPTGWTARSIFMLLSITVVLGGAATMMDGDLHYSNYWGGSVFAPFAIAAGLFLLVLAVAGWKRISGPDDERKLKGKAARLARQAEQTKFPIDDYEKW